MRILIASTIVPFIDGGASFIVNWLAEVLKSRGFEVEVLMIPFSSYYPHMPEQMLGLRLMDLQNVADLLITIRTPSYLLSHPNKVVWFIHHHRGAYDLWGTEYQDLPNNTEGTEYRKLIIESDNKHLHEAKKIFTNSKIVGSRLKQFNDIDSTILYPPLLNPDRFKCGHYGNYVFYPSRIISHKRQLLAIKSMQYTQSPARLIIAGNPDNIEYISQIKAYIEQYNLNTKVEIIDRWISEQEKIDLIANSLAGIYIPYNEDSYGYPTLEFFHSNKAVITCKDSGGTLEIINDEINGYISEAEPKAIAEKIDLLYFNKEKAKHMGKKAHASIYELGITWNHVIASLTT